VIEKNIDQIKRFDFRSGLANLEKNANGLFCLKVKTFLLLNYYKAGWYLLNTSLLHLS